MEHKDPQNLLPGKRGVPCRSSDDPDEVRSISRNHAALPETSVTSVAVVNPAERIS